MEYVRKYIESAEMAEALLPGSVAYSDDFQDEDIPYVKMMDQRWISPWEGCHSEECEDYPYCPQISYATFANSGMVGDYVLVPKA